MDIKEKTRIFNEEQFANVFFHFRRKDGSGEDENESSSEGEEASVSSAYMPHISRVVWAENTDKKSGKSKTEITGWFPALVVAPSACDTVQIDTKEDFLIRSFKDGRYYTVSKKDTNRFCKETAWKDQGGDTAHLKDGKHFNKQCLVNNP